MMFARMRKWWRHRRPRPVGGYIPADGLFYFHECYRLPRAELEKYQTLHSAKQGITVVIINSGIYPRELVDLIARERRTIKRDDGTSTPDNA